MNWIDLVSIDQVETIKKESNEGPVLIFKHSTTCSISAMAYNRLQRGAFNFKFYYLDLREHRDVSNYIASTFDVIHESPQVLLIDKGVAVYNASHGEINPKEILSVTN
jgi:bacillithiol system protein YtxJ